MRARKVSSVKERWSEANIQEVVSLFDFNQEQEKKLRELQVLVEDVGEYWKNDPLEVARYLAEFRKLPAPKIAQLFRNMVEWRQSENMDTFCQDYGTPSAVFQYLPLYLMKDLDYDGNPLYVMRVGALDAFNMYNRVGGEALLAYTKFLQEITTTPDLQGVPKEFNWQSQYYEPKMNGRRLSQFTMLVDLEGLSSRRHLRPSLFGVLNAVARVGQDYYAGFGRRIILLRAPRIFQVAWNLVKHFFDPHIIALINVTTASDYLEVCDQFFDRRALPSCMCPEGEGQPMPGYFECVKMEGGPIPEHLDLTTPCSSTPWQQQRRRSASTTGTSFSSSLSDEPTTATNCYCCKSMTLVSGRLDFANQVVIEV